MEFIKTARLMSHAQRGRQKERRSMLYIVLSHVEFVIYCIVTCGVGYILYYHMAVGGAQWICQCMLIPIADAPREKRNCGLIG